MHSSFGVGSAIGRLSVRRRWRQSARRPLRSAVPIAPAAPVISTRSVAGLIIAPSAQRATRSTAARYSSISRSSGATSTCCTPAALYASSLPRSAPASCPSSGVRSEMVNAASGRPARRRCTIAGACSGVTRLPCQPSSRSARAIAASDEPPIQIGIGAHGFGCMRIVSIFAGIQRVGNVTGSSLHTAFIMAMPSSMRRPRSRNGTPRASNSASIQPTPAPRISRPCDRFCSVASSFASGSGWRIGSTSTLVPSFTRCV